MLTRARTALPPKSLKTMPTPDLALGFGSVIYALAKLDGRLRLAEMQTVKELLANEPHGDLALHTFFLRENYGEPAHEAYAFGMRRLKANRMHLDRTTRKRYADVLRKVAEADSEFSPQERDFVRQFSRELQQK